jgi:hypothetical protein
MSRGRCQLAVLMVAQASGQTGAWAALVCALPYALGRADPAFWLSAITAAWAGPAVAAGLAGGAIDRHGPRVVGTLCWLAAAAAAALCAVAGPRLPDLLTVLGCISLSGAVAEAAGNTAPTWMPSRPRLPEAGSWLVIAADLPVAGGPIGASQLITHYGWGISWLFAAVMFAVGAIGSALVAARRPEIAGAEQRGRLHPGLCGVLIVTAGVFVSYGAITILEVLYVRTVLSYPITMYGWLLAIWSAAGCYAAAVAGAWPRIMTSRWSIPYGVLIVGLGEGIYIGTRFIAVAVAGSVIFGIGAALFRLSCRAKIVAVTPAERHGWALSWWQSVQLGCDIAPAAVASQLTRAYGLRTVLVGSSALVGVLAMATSAVVAWLGVPGRHRAVVEHPPGQHRVRPQQQRSDEVGWAGGRRALPQLGYLASPVYDAEALRRSRRPGLH